MNHNQDRDEMDAADRAAETDIRQRAMSMTGENLQREAEADAAELLSTSTMTSTPQMTISEMETSGNPFFKHMVTWAANDLQQAIAETWYELAKTSPSFEARYRAKARLMYDIEQAVKEEGNCTVQPVALDAIKVANAQADAAWIMKHFGH